MENFEHLGFLIFFGEKGSENVPLCQNAPFFANSDPDMPAVPVPAPQVHDWLLENISSALEHIAERVSTKENGPTSSSDPDVPMADVSPISAKSTTFTRGPSFIEGISKSSCLKRESDLQGSSVKVNLIDFINMLQLIRRKIVVIKGILFQLIVNSNFVHQHDRK